MKEVAPPEVTRILLQVLTILLLLGGAFWILEPFIPAILWATIIVITTWPLFLGIQRRMWNKRILAIMVMIGAILVVVIVPCALAIGSIIGNMDDITKWANSLRHKSLPPAPGFLGGIPLFGPKLVDGWNKIEAVTAEGWSKYLAPYTGEMATWILSKAGSVGMLMLQFLFTVIIATVLYAQGESTAGMVRAFCRRLAGARGEEIATLATKSIRSVALGVVVTALAQTLLCAIGLFVSGMPSALLLSAVIFVLCLCQVGPVPVLVPAIIYLYWRGTPVSGTVMLVFGVITLPLDNFLRPMLIRKGADMPLLLVFISVIGGLVAMGVIGLFIGPVILAVALALLKSWIKGETGKESAVAVAADEKAKPEAITGETGPEAAVAVAAEEKAKPATEA